MVRGVCFWGLMAGLLVGFRLEGAAEIRVSEIGRSINAFTLDFMKALPDETRQRNVAVSPQSIYHTLAMSYIASGEDTRQELAKTFHFPEENERLLSDLATLRRELKNDAGHAKIEFDLANSAWIDRTYATFRDSYVRQVQEAFEADVQGIGFGDGASASRIINRWASEKTRGKVRGSLGPGDLVSRSRPGIIDEPGLVLVNAIYFKSDWASRFNKSETRDRLFYMPDGESRQTAFMHQHSLLRYSKDEAFQFLELPYVDGKFAMLVLLPQETIGVEAMLRGMSEERIFDLLRQSSIHEVDVLLPKFEIESHLAAAGLLQAMGVHEAFDRHRANFDAMIHKKSEAYRIYVSEVYHDAAIEVHEEGTKAAAATTSVNYSFGCSTSMSVTPPAVFHADHPFLFLIVHAPSRSILFAGWMAKPA